MKANYHYSNLGIILLLFLTTAAFGQSRIDGVITDEVTGEPLPGVNVLIPAQSLGSITGLDGSFSISNVPDGEHTVEATFVGYRTISQTATVNGSAVTLDFGMNEVATELDEIVVTGTGGPVEKKRIGNTVGSISTKQLEDMPINSFSDLLTGREPGMQALTGGGLVGEGTQIRIRGSASLSQINEPIIIIDGVRVDNGGGFGDNQGALVSAGGGGSPSRLDDINPDAIERVEILKGAAAATLYGTEASNGVIQIFTKKGAKGKPQFEAKVVQGIIKFPNRVPNNFGFARTAEQAADLSAFYGRTIQPYELIETTATEDLFGTGYQQTYSFGVRGGTDILTYYASARLLDQDGPFDAKNRNYSDPDTRTLAEDLNRKANFNMNLGVTPTDKVKMRVTAGYTDSSFETPQTNNNIFGVGSLAQFSKPELASASNETGTIAFATVNETLQLEVKQKARNFNGSYNLNYSPLPWLVVDGVVGINFINSRSEQITPFGWDIDNFTSNNTEGQINYTQRNFQAVSWEVKASARNQISPSVESDFIIGGQLIKQQETIDSGQGTNLPGPGFGVTSAAGDITVFNFFQETVNAGIFAQEVLAFKDQFFLTLGARLDAHSAFGSNFNAVLYPKVAFSWVLSDASWWGSGYGPVSSFQLKGAVGQSGLQPGAFDAQTTYQSHNAITGAGISPDNLGNADLEPEIATEFELGTSIGLLNDKVSAEITYWNRTVSDAMFQRQFPLTGGWRNQQLVNIGEVQAHGWEISVNGSVYKKGDWSVDVFVNAAYISEEITDLGGAPPIKVGDSYPRYRNFLIEGLPPGFNLGAKLADVTADQLPIDIVNGGDGVADSRAELTTWLADAANATSLPSSVGTGGVLLADDDGDGDLLDHPLGKNVPDWQGSVGGTVKWKNFTLRTNFEYRAGDFWINNLTNAFRQANSAIGRNLRGSATVERDYIDPSSSGALRVDALDRWLNQNLALSPFSGLNTIERGDFIRWRELALTYRIPRSVIEGLGLNTASFTVAARNLAIWTKYTGVDPEINVFGRGGDSDNADQNFGQGIDAFGWPVPTTILFTAKVGF